MAPGLEQQPSSPGRLSSGVAPRSLFPQGPSFTLEIFSSRDFIVKDFIEELSDSAVPGSRKSGATSNQATSQPFDPKPLIRRLEQAQEQLRELSSELESRETELSGAVRRAEAQHENSVKNLSRKLESSVRSFRQLNESLNGRNGGAGDDGALRAVRIGERLEELDRQRLRAQDAKFLIRCWADVSERGDLASLENIRASNSSAEKIKCARVAKQLLKISQRLDVEHWDGAESSGRAKTTGVNGVNGINGTAANGDTSSKPKFNTREIIEKFSEELEKDLLAQFDEFYRRANFDGMRECATVLEDFGGGASVIGMFVNQHQFFIDRNNLILEEVAGEPELWEAMTDPDADSPGIEPSLQNLIDEVKAVLFEESGIIKQSFPYYEVVLGRFLQRIFQQSIQQRLERVLEKASSISTLAFLRSLQAARGYIGSFIDELKAHGLTEHPDVMSSQSALVLDQQLEDLFVPYFVGSSYIEREKRNLEELYSSLLFKFTAFHSRKRKAPTGYLASLASSGRDMLASAREAYVERLDSSEMAPQQKARMMRLAGLKDNDSTRKQADQEFNEEDGTLSTSNSKRMLKWLAEAVGRTLELSGGVETAKDVSALLDLLLLHMGQLYVETALDAATDAAASQEKSKSEPDLSYLENLHASITTLHLMVSCINTVLIPLAASSSSTRREMEKTTAAALTRFEERVSALMQRTIDISIGYVQRSLNTQAKTDFRPKDDMLMAADQTPTCRAVTSYLERVQKAALLALSPSPNLTSFLTELALQLRPLLLAHFQKWTVSAIGGIMVQKDIARYREVLAGWELGDTWKGTLEMLSEVGTLFVVAPQTLKERLKGRPLAERGELRAYVLRREDSGSVGVQSVLAGL